MSKARLHLLVLYQNKQEKAIVFGEKVKNICANILVFTNSATGLIFVQSLPV